MDVASLRSNVKKGNYISALVDAGAAIVDIAAVVTPFVPGGAGTAVKAYRNANAFRNNIRAGKEFERSVVGAAKKEGRNVSSQITIIPKNGVGNVKGNRSRVDMLEKKKDGKYVAYEIKLSPKSKPSKGQKAIENHVKKGNQLFEVRTNNGGFKKGNVIRISEYRYIYK
jgi:hypothetical protein